jgi:hypothetical protein
MWATGGGLGAVEGTIVTTSLVTQYSPGIPPASALHTPYGIAVDSTNVYWAGGGPWPDEPSSVVFKIPKPPAPPVAADH